ncbi:YDG/SRA domain-containing protein [Amycolatopsis sp. NPDC051903]|uniref:YDG/SRA domain-containing protein n=1 Tax=Amycolatopsis sp. NPDC051903 TaxID=3363936 RepID=UPI0037AF9C83
MLGEIAGIDEKSTFASRREAYEAGVHRALQAGIVGTGDTGAESIVVSGGYPDDVDEGSWLLYTGHGGRDPATRRQIAHQRFDSPGNAALETSRIQGLAVRVIRKVGKVYRYGGLFRVEESMLVYPTGGEFKVCRFEMVKIDKAIDATYAPVEVEVSAEEHHPDLPIGNFEPGRRSSNVQRIIRSTEVAERVKTLYDHTCQMCGIKLVVTGDRGYSEGAHIQALGGLHRGPDVVENMLCLCPNCHVLFDSGALIVEKDRSLLLNGKPAVLNNKPAPKLREHQDHHVDDKYLAHHREARGKS